MAVSGSLNTMRISGLASGLDTEKIVSDMMKAERIPLDRLKQNQQLTEWKQNDYRDIINLLSDFNKAYMDVVSPTTNMRSAAQYKKFIVNVANSNGLSSNILTASGTTNAYAGSHTVVVKQTATSAKATSATGISAVLQSGDLRGTLALTDKKMNITLDGVTKEIAFNSDYTIDSQINGDAFAAELQSKIEVAFGTGIEGQPKVKVTYDNTNGKISFVTAAGSNKISVASSTTNDALASLGMTNNSSNRINLSSTLGTLQNSFNVTGGLVFEADPDDNNTEKIKFTINNKEFSFTKDTKLSTVINTINNDPTANVNLSYDTITDKFTLTSKQTGSGKNITIKNTLGNFFGENSVLGINPETAGFGANGQDAIVKIDGQDLVRSSNTFTEGGITYNLTKADPDTEVTVSLSADIDSVYNNIDNFIKKYNEVIDKIYSKMTEPYDSDYPPLTDAQKEDMEQSDIEKWEATAKKGLLWNDPALQKILTSFRESASDPINGVDTSLAKIGISSQSHLDRGKLTINEAKLKQALQNDPDGVMNLFCKQSTSQPDYDRKATLAQKNQRISEEGFVNRLYDIVQDNISIIMDSDKKKGYLLEKAGMKGDTTDTSSVLSQELKKQKEAIAEMEEKLYDKEEYYYKKFTAMETAMSKLNSQSSWISSMLNSSSS